MDPSDPARLQRQTVLDKVLSQAPPPPALDGFPATLTYEQQASRIAEIEVQCARLVCAEHNRHQQPTTGGADAGAHVDGKAASLQRDIINNLDPEVAERAKLGVAPSPSRTFQHSGTRQGSACRGNHRWVLAALLAQL